MSLLPSDEGPEVYRLSRAYPPEAAAALIEGALGSAVARIERDTVSGSHAVFFATLAGGEECVARIATHPEHNLARELWAAEQCRQRGVPVPPVLTSATARAGNSLPYVISDRARGAPAYGAALTTRERRAIFEQLGRYAALIHGISLPGFGDLVPSSGGYVGRDRSLWDHLDRQLRSAIEALPADVLPPARARSILERFEHERPLLDRAAGGLVHGDYRFKNVLIEGSRVCAILDFEMAVSGDPAQDLAWLLYSDGRDREDEAALVRGYVEGGGRMDKGFMRRVACYQLLGALGTLWWMVGFRDEVGTGKVSERIRKLEELLDTE